MIPLATILRPKTLEDFVGQHHVLGDTMPLFQAIQTGELFSIIFWGSPGSGKTTLAHIMANSVHAHFIAISAVMAGVKEIRQAVSDAHAMRASENRKTVLFVDEVHRFNKAQQDAFLPYLEDGTFIFIGATTENPSFALNNALLSRAQVVVLKPHNIESLKNIVDRAVTLIQENYNITLSFESGALNLLLHYADGDARRILNALELIMNQAKNKGSIEVNKDFLQNLFSGNIRRFDKEGDIFYEQISALHKAVRGSSPDAALYWFARMIEGACDPLYIARRIVRMATEDIGNADPRGLEIALNAWDAQHRLGSPEGELALAQALVYLAVAPKSNAVYVAYKQALHDAKAYGSQPVPIHLRNAPTELMKAQGYAQAYRYDHDEEEGIAYGQQYFPDNMGEKIYYKPVARGIESKIAEKLDKIRKNTD